MMEPDQSAYRCGLALLARRELSEAQVRQRLGRRGYEPASVDAAVARLKRDRAIDDVRAAGVIARMQVAVKGRGRLRVRREIELAGIDRDVASAAAAEAFGERSEDELLTAALERRLAGRSRVADDREFQRLYRRLVRQGFDAERVSRALEARRAR